MDKASITRLLIALLTAANTVLTALGYPVIPDDLINSIVIIAGFIFEAYAMWKNNYISKKGRKQKEVLEKAGLN
jgi:SPP1 family holin